MIKRCTLGFKGRVSSGGSLLWVQGVEGGKHNKWFAGMGGESRSYFWQA